MISEIIETLTNQFIQKNTAYSGSAHETYMNFGAVSYAIRIHDKLKRYEQLTQNPDIPFGDEAIEDTLGDAVTYTAMFAADLKISLGLSPYDEHFDETLELLGLLGANTDEEIVNMANTFATDIIGKRSLTETIIHMYNEKATITQYVLLAAYLLNIMNERMMRN